MMIEKTKTKTKTNPHNLINVKVFERYVSERSPDRLLRVLNIFSSELDEKIRKLPLIINNRDVEALRSLTHSLLGSAAMVGAQRIVNLSSTLHQAVLDSQEIDWASAIELRLAAEQTSSVFKSLNSICQIEDFIKRDP